MTQQIAVALVGQNANDILEWWSAELNAHLETLGLATALIDLRKDDWLKTFADATEGRQLLFAWSFQGIGGALKADDGTNLWDRMGVTFLSYMGDNPCYLPRNHRIAARNVLNAYSCPDFLEVQRRFVKSDQFSFLLPHAFPANPHVEEVAWKDRQIDFLFVKNGNDPDALSRGWGVLPRRVRDAVWASVEIALADPGRQVADVVAGVLEEMSWVLGDRTELFWYILAQVDDYVRRRHATRLANIVKKLPAHIFGGNWEHLDMTGAKAIFHGTVAAWDLPKLYANTRTMFNANPNIVEGVHERVYAAFSSDCCLVSDDTAFARRHFAGLPSYVGFDWNEDDLEDRILTRVTDGIDYGDAVRDARERVAPLHSIDAFFAAIFEMIEVNTLIPKLAPLRQV